MQAYEANIRLHAGHAHPSGRQASAETPTVPTVQGGSHGNIHGNKNTKIYHLPTCPGYAGMNAASVVMLAHEAEAQQAGFRKAKNCR